MEKQYIGARYVPKFADPIEWQEGAVYDALTIVTYMGASYTSKKFVPAGVKPTDNRYWVITGNYNAQVEQYREEVVAVAGKVSQIFSAEEGSDVTNKLQESINKGNIILTGNQFYISGTVKIPSGHMIYSNGTVLKCANGFIGNYAIEVGSADIDNTDAGNNTGLFGVNIDCNRVASGILILGRLSEVQESKITNVIASGVGIDVWRSDDTPVPNSMDAFISHVDIVNRFTNDVAKCETYQVGVRCNGSDNYITHVRTYNSIIGISLNSSAGGSTLIGCHTLAFNSKVTGWERSVGYDVACECVLDDCYADNFRYAVNTKTAGATCTVSNFKYYCWEYGNTVERIVFQDCGGALEVFGCQIPHSNYVVGYKMTNDYWVYNIYGKIINGSLPYSPFYKPSDAYWRAYLRGETMYPVVGASEEVVIGVIDPNDIAQPSTFSVTSKLYSINNLVIEGWTGNVQDWGTATGVTTVATYTGDDGMLYIKATVPSEWDEGAIVEVHSLTARVLPYQQNDVPWVDMVLKETHTY